MDTRLVILSVHVLTAVLGVGPLFAMALIAADATSSASRDNLRHLVLLSRIIQWALVLMFITGLLLLWESSWIYMHMRWLPVAFGLFVFVGAALGMTNRPIRKAATNPAPGDLLRVQRLAWICVALVAVIVVLMVLKPV